MRRLLKFLHTIGAIGMMGALACLIVLMTFVPPPARLAEYALMYGAMAKIATWVFFPSLVVTVISGLLSIGVTPAFHEAGWAWAKLATGVLILESGMVYIQGPIKEEASRAASALAGELNPAEISGLLRRGEQYAMVPARRLRRQCRARHLAPEVFAEARVAFPITSPPMR